MSPLFIMWGYLIRSFLEWFTVKTVPLVSVKLPEAWLFRMLLPRASRAAKCCNLPVANDDILYLYSLLITDRTPVHFEVEHHKRARSALTDLCSI